MLAKSKENMLAALSKLDYKAFFEEAAHLDQSEIINFFIKLDASEKHKLVSLSYNGCNILHIALMKDLYDFAALLLQHGVDPMAKIEREDEYNGYTALALACGRKAPLKVIILLAGVLTEEKFMDMVWHLSKTSFTKEKYRRSFLTLLLPILSPIAWEHCW